MCIGNYYQYRYKACDFDGEFIALREKQCSASCYGWNELFSFVSKLCTGAVNTRHANISVQTGSWLRALAHKEMVRGAPHQRLQRATLQSGATKQGDFMIPEPPNFANQVTAISLSDGSVNSFNASQSDCRMIDNIYSLESQSRSARIQRKPIFKFTFREGSSRMLEQTGMHGTIQKTTFMRWARRTQAQHLAAQTGFELEYEERVELQDMA